jgi:hypothetical protein
MTEPKLADVLGPPEHQLALCAAFAWLWVAAADGSLDLKTHAYLERELASLPGALKKRDALLSIIAMDDAPSFLLACRILQRDLSAESRAGFLATAVRVAAASGKLSISANHILRLFSDMLDFSTEALAELYSEVSGESLPEPPDLSSVAWWRSQTRGSADEKNGARQRASEADGGNDQEAGEQAEHTRYRYIPAHRFSRAEAFAVLGLRRGAPRAEVKQAYRRLVQSYHPDRFEGDGAEAQRVAEDKFLRVQQAYEVLNQ